MMSGYTLYITLFHYFMYMVQLWGIAVAKHFMLAARTLNWLNFKTENNSMLINKYEIHQSQESRLSRRKNDESSLDPESPILQSLCGLNSLNIHLSAEKKGYQSTSLSHFYNAPWVPAKQLYYQHGFQLTAKQLYYCILSRNT